MINELDLIALSLDTDKNSLKHNYTEWYDYYFNSIRNENLNILEIGIAKGSSLLMWKKYFKNSNIFGIDIKDKNYKTRLPGIKYFIGDASDKSFLLKVNSDIDDGLDIIIDDASHIPRHQILGFESLFPKLNKGGIYVVEDLQTSYREHKNYGENAVNYFKNLVDDVNFYGKNRHQNINIVKEKIMKKANEYEKTIKSIHFYMGICFIFKR
jgi:cephalosporin hydroxylase